MCPKSWCSLYRTLLHMVITPTTLVIVLKAAALLLLRLRLISLNISASFTNVQRQLMKHLSYFDFDSSVPAWAESLVTLWQPEWCHSSQLKSSTLIIGEASWTAHSWKKQMRKEPGSHHDNSSPWRWGKNNCWCGQWLNKWASSVTTTENDVH